MYSNEEIKEIYDSRYKNSQVSPKKREIDVYKMYRSVLFEKEKCFNKILDLGCGLGNKTVGFTRENENVLAIDLSHEAIDIASATFSACRNIRFIEKNGMEVEGQFELITAFGFSLFNTSDNNGFIKLVHFYLTNNLSDRSGSSLVIGSFTDFSGKGEETWYQHTTSDLEIIKKGILEYPNLKVRIIFPHKILKTYIGFGIVNFAKEFIKLMVKSKKTFFIIIEHE